MATININSQVPVFRSVQVPVVYEQLNAPQYPHLDVILAPSTDALMPTYSSGRILAQYDVDSPLIALIGAYVNYDPTSLIPSQKIPVAILSDEFVRNATGVDTTSIITATATINTVSVSPLLIGLTLYANSVISSNATAVYTAFSTYFIIKTLESVMLGQTYCPLISIQGVK